MSPEIAVEDEEEDDEDVVSDINVGLVSPEAPNAVMGRFLGAG
jgi:hypothetical protein